MKIPVKIIEFADGDKKIQEVMIDLIDTIGLDGDPGKKLSSFRKKYFALVKKAQKIMPKDKSKRKTSHFWKIGKLLYDFNKSIENEFEITNYQQAVIRDFGLYESWLPRILKIGEFFTKNDISDNVPFSHYHELIDKIPILEKSSFGKEKKRLLKRAKDDTLPTTKEYRKELNALVKSKKRVSVRRT